MITARTLTPGRSRRRAWHQGTGGEVSGRTAGRHRDQGRRQPSMLVLDYPADHGPIRFRTTAATPFHRGSAFRANPLTSRRTLGVAAVVALILVVAGGFALLGSPGPSHGGNAATAGVPLPALTPAPGASSSPPGQIASHRHRAVRRQTPVAQAQAPAATRPSPTAVHGPAIAVRYIVDNVWSSGFQGQVVVTNNSSSPIADWQIVMALNGDVVTSVSNASSFFGDSILLLQPGVNGQTVAPHGGTLSVTFVAEGVRTVPVACAFNGIPCA